ncbi:hypothetical protein E2542_SST04317 [Spatholobus suberectus]|nr:hypothetical protein E2542_SST04317 [Spatholobus suberectus]
MKGKGAWQRWRSGDMNLRKLGDVSLWREQWREVARELIGARSESVMVLDGLRKTMLHLCVEHNHLETLKTLVQVGDVSDDFLNFGDFYRGNTILHLAVMLKQIETVRYLLSVSKIREEANIENKMGYTAVDMLEHDPKDLRSLQIQLMLMDAGIKNNEKNQCNKYNKNHILLHLQITAATQLRARVLRDSRLEAVAAVTAFSVKLSLTRFANGVLRHDVKGPQYCNLVLASSQNHPRRRCGADLRNHITKSPHRPPLSRRQTRSSHHSRACYSRRCSHARSLNPFCHHHDAKPASISLSITASAPLPHASRARLRAFNSRRWMTLCWKQERAGRNGSFRKERKALPLLGWNPTLSFGVSDGLVPIFDTHGLWVSSLGGCAIDTVGPNSVFSFLITADVRKWVKSSLSCNFLELLI